MNLNELLSKKYKEICRVLNYIVHSLIIISTITGFVSISAFGSLIVISIRITISAIRVKICIITARIKSISQEKRKKVRSMIK